MHYENDCLLSTPKMICENKIKAGLTIIKLCSENPTYISFYGYDQL